MSARLFFTAATPHCGGLLYCSVHIKHPGFLTSTKYYVILYAIMP